MNAQALLAAIKICLKLGKNAPLVAIPRKSVMDKRFEVALPEEVLAHFGWKEAETPRKLRDLVIMELLRHDRLSEAEAANLLQLDRWELLELMGHYRIPAIRMSQEELREELARKLTPGKRV